MECRISKIFLASLISLAVFFSIEQSSLACGWYEDGEAYRVAMFRAELPYMQAFRPFYYTPSFLNSYLPDPDHEDWKRNCAEWQKAMSANIKLNDIEVILYKVSPDQFLLYKKNNSLADEFEENTFISQLLKPGNKDYLEYLTFAKQNEFYNFMESDPWEENEDNFKAKYAKDLIDNCMLKVRLEKNEFLNIRYAFQLVRLYHLTNEYDNAITTFNTWIGDKFETSIVGIWALQHKALCLDNLGQRIEANYLYSKVFDLCDEKKLRVFQAFNDTTSVLNSTLKLAKNTKEKAAILALSCFKNPGPALEKIKQIYQFDPENKSILPLIMREINKLEDWIYTPELTTNTPSFYYDYANIEKTNRQKDIGLLRELRDFLQTIFPKSTGSKKQFLAVSLAHLFFIDDVPVKARQYLATIENTAPSGVLVQMNIEKVLDAIYSGNCSEEAVQNQIYTGIKGLEKLAERNNFVFKVLYSLSNKLSNNFKAKNLLAQAGLLNMQGQQYKSKYNYTDDYQNTSWSDYYLTNNYYWNIAWFDANSTAADVELLIKLLSKTQKTPFEKYLTQNQEKQIPAYLDLLGTMYFREDKLDAAYLTFAKLPEDYWTKTYRFKDYLNENPFIPKIYPDKRNFSYKFSKKEFVKNVLDLKVEAEQNKEKRAENYLKIGHLYYNCTWWGNSWMMMSYSWSSIGASDILAVSKTKTPDKQNLVAININEAYKNCTRAEIWYKKVLDSKPNSEIAAQAYFMLHCIDYNKYVAVEEAKDYDNAFKTPYKPVWLRPFYTTYQTTSAFSNLRCSKLDDFAAKF